MAHARCPSGQAPQRRPTAPQGTRNGTTLALGRPEEVGNPAVNGESRHLKGCPRLSGPPKTAEVWSNNTLKRRLSGARGRARKHPQPSWPTSGDPNRPGEAAQKSSGGYQRVPKPFGRLRYYGRGHRGPPGRAPLGELPRSAQLVSSDLVCSRVADDATRQPAPERTGDRSQLGPRHPTPLASRSNTRYSTLAIHRHRAVRRRRRLHTEWSYLSPPETNANFIGWGRECRSRNKHIGRTRPCSNSLETVIP